MTHTSPPDTESKVGLASSETIASPAESQYVNSMVSGVTWGWVAMTANLAPRGQRFYTFTCQYSLGAAGGGGVGSGAGSEDEEGSGGRFR